MACRQCDKLITPTKKEPIGRNDERTDMPLDERGKGCVDVVFGTGVHGLKLQPERMGRRLSNLAVRAEWRRGVGRQARQSGGQNCIALQTVGENLHSQKGTSQAYLAWLSSHAVEDYRTASLFDRPEKDFRDSMPQTRAHPPPVGTAGRAHRCALLPPPGHSAGRGNDDHAFKSS